jgi:hypothetical protein
MRLARIVTLVCLATVVGGVTFAHAAEPRHSGTPRRSTSEHPHKRAHCHRVKKKRVCPSKHSKKKIDPKPALPKPTTPTTPSTPPTPPACPQDAPLPTPAPGQTTIVGYATLYGGPPPQPSSCPSPPESLGGTVVLQTSAGQTIESQTVAAGQPYQFVVQPGNYLVADSTCMVGMPVTAVAGQQNRADVGCNIP